MLALTHALFALLIATIVYLAAGVQVSVVALLTAMLGGIFPDIDEEHSVITKKTGPLGWIVSKLAKHRGMFHSLLGGAVITGLLLLALLKVNVGFLAIWFLFGYLSHLLADSFNPTGIAWLAPFSKWKLTGYATTGSLSEKIFCIAVAIAVFILLLKLEGFI